MKKKFVRLISAVLSAAMTLTAVPLSAFAEGETHTHDGESNVITTPLDFREKTADENGIGWSWVYDTKTLTLDGVNIQATTDSMSVVTVPDGTEIVLNGENTIVQTDTGESYTYVLSAVNTNDINCDGTMTISGDGVLNAENRSTDSMARSLGGTIILNGGTVNATGKVVAKSLEIHNDGVLNANASATSYDGAAVNVGGSITVDGNGSLNAVGCAIENQDIMNTAILLNGNQDSKISVTGNGSITVPDSNGARYGICYDVDRRRINAEISGKVTAYGTMCGISGINLIMSGTGSVYATGDILGIDNTDTAIDENEFVIKGSTEYKASESTVTSEVTLYGVYYKIDGEYAKTLVIKPDTSPRIILGNQIGIFKTEEYKLIEDMDMTDIKLKGTVYFDITLKNMSDEEFADARGYFGGDEPDLSASIIKTDYGWVCMVCDTVFSTTYDTDNTLTIKCGDIVSNTVQVKSNANRFNKVTQGDNTNRTVFYTNTSQEEKDNYKLVSTYTVDSESISYNWYSTNSAYSADELGAAVSGSNGEFKLADNIPAGNYVLYCDITYSDGDSTETVTEKFTFTYKECAHENGYSDGKCTNCGALCDHSNIDIGTGKCKKCAHQYVATISTDGSAPTGYDTLKDCLDSITADSGNYVKIYQDIGDATATLDTINVNHNVMVDLNGHKLNNIKLGVNKDFTLTLTGTEGSYVTQVYVRNGGSFVIDSDTNAGFETIFVEDNARLTVSEGAKVTTEQLTVIASVADDGTTTTSVKLATGTKIGALSYHRQNNSGALKLGNLLDVTRQALQRDDNGEYLDLYREYGVMSYPVALTVVEHTDADHKYGTGTGKCKECGKPCEHSGEINTDNGICSICGAIVSVAIYTDANGISKYVDADELHSLLNEYNGSGTVKLFKDYNNSKAQYDLYGELTIELNGRQFNIRSITPCKNGKLTIKNSGNPVMLGCNVYPTSDTNLAGGTLIIDGDVVLDTSIYVYDSSTVILKDGTYPAGLYARDSKTLYDMLGEGKAFFKTDGTLFNASVKEISSSETLTVKDHSHTYVDGKCDCGYVCPHSDVDIDTGKCTECEYQYAAVIVKDGTVASVHEENEMVAAFEAADSDANTGCTLRVYKNYTGSYTKLSGKFTLWIAKEANVGTLTVSGDITVTGSEKNNSIYGDFNVAAGGKLTFDENCGAKGTVSVGAGTFDCYCSLGTTLNINDASSDVILHYGTFKKICYNGGGDRANAEILTLLAENRMFMKLYGEPIDGSKTLLKDGFATTVLVIRHEDHGYDSTTGKCKICGKRCGHTDVDSKTGVCPTCKYQLTAGISGVGTAKYFDNIDNAFTAALSAENNGCTLTLYKNCTLSNSVTIANATVTVDVNGYSLVGDKHIVVNSDGVLYLKDSRENGSIDTEIEVNKGGTLINGTADDSSSAVSVFSVYADAAKCVEIYGGSCTCLTVNNGTSGIALYGGSYELIHTNDLTDSTPVSALLAKGYAFAILNSVTHLPEKIVDGSATTLNPGLENVAVLAHTHTYTETNTKCACGVCALAIFTETTQSEVTYTFIESATQFKNIAENEADGVLKLTGNVDCIVKGIIINGNKTIDMNGHTLNVSVGTEEISAVAVNGNVTFENSGSSRAVINATGVYSYGMVTVNGDIEFDNFATFEDGDALINAGVFKNIYVQGRSVIEILGSGKALASESGEILNASVQQIYKAGNNIFVKAHPKHTYDDHCNCACGYKCLHDGEGQVNEDSANKVCSECGAKIYAKVTTADGKVKYFDDITEGLRYADKAENKGCVFTLVTTGGLENDITLSSGQFTITAIDDNYINAYTRKINIKGAEITVENCAFNCFVGLYSGSLTYPEGSTSVCINGISVFGGTLNISDGVSENFGANKFTISDTATDAKVTIGGGIYSEIKLGQYTFKDILASGTRLISVEYSQETDEIIATNELLYSIVSEQNTLGVDDDKDYRFVKCDHKNDDGSYAFNEGGICKYCNSEFAASVSYTTDDGEKTELVGDIYDAFAKANAAGTATVTLYKNIENNITDTIAVTGNVTLELNGKKLTTPGFEPYYAIEVKSGKLTVNGSGSIKRAVVRNGGDAEINGGTFSDFRIEDGGNAVINGGQFYSIKVSGEGRNVGQLLADGYAYKSLDGYWSTIAEREKQGIASVNVLEAPIKSASISWADGETPVIYRNGDKYLRVNVMTGVAKPLEYSDFANGNMISTGGTVAFRGVIDFSGASVGNVGVADGEVEYYCIFTRNGYEYKTNTLKFTLATCSHPEDSFTEKDSNGWVRCGICDLRIEAQVIKADGELLGYASVYQAIKLAQKNEGNTVKLISERVPASITVTGGKFTVDFNGKEAYYQFDVNGGDVTFTSSVKQADAENPLSIIKVNGTDAKVTIDGKIKLGRVRTISGTLTVNSTQGYIKELSIIGGNAVIDDAIIGALQTNGGDTVINCVEADSLSVNINGSGSISIVTGTFGSTTCKTGLGMAIASGSVVLSSNMNGITVYTYEAIQTMTKTDRIFVDKCSHKDGKGSYVLDGNPCPYCNKEIVATVSYTAGGEETELFSDIYDAFERANKAGTATVTLYKDITDSELTRGVTVTGDITLISKANNKLNNTVNVADGGKLTIRGDGIVSGVTAEAGSTVTVEENVEITNLTVSGGDVQLSGGRYTSITVNGGKIVDLLASGYAYKFLLTGLWLNIEQREQQVAEYVTVTKAPILSAELTANKTKAYRYGENNVRFSATANMASGFEVNYNNSLTFKLYIGGNLEDEYTERSDNYRNTSVDECEIWDYVGKDGKIKVYTVVKYNGYEVRTNEVEIETVTCKNSAEKVINTGNGKYMCSECGNYVYFEIAKTNGDVEYTYNIKNALERTQQDTNYKGCVIKAVCATNEVFSFADVNGADFTFDLNGCSILISSDMTITDSTVVFKDSQNGGGLSYVGGASGNISIAFKNSNVTVESGVYDLIFNIGEGCTVNLNGGEFHHIEVHDGNKTLYDLLGENKAFTTSDGKLFDASNVSESDNLLTVIDHSKHVYDEIGRCGCGYQCPHDDVDTKAGVCRECNTKIYAAITVKSETGTTVKYFTKLTEAFEFAAKNENNGCTLKMLRAFSDSNTDINVDGGVLTVDMNGFGVNIHSFNGSGTKITIRSDSKCTFGVENGFSMDGGTVTFSGEVSVVCQNVKLNATYFSSYVEMLDIDTLILEDGVPLKQLARITNANIANINCSSEIYLYQILASGSCVDSQLYSALKANASSNFDNVRIIRCDHPDGVGRDNRCIYCNSLIAASVSYTENGAEKTEYFVKEDLGKAFAKANSVASATITMLMSSAYDTDYLPVTGDVTLIANGDNAILYNTVKVADGGKLTLRGNANIFAAIAEPGSRLTAEEATRIAYLTVNGGDVKLSGGQYDNITVKDGKITDILGNGYAYKKTEGGAWLTLKEREVSEASGVTVAKAPIVQATLSAEINKLYRNSNANPTLKFNLALAHGPNLNDSYVSKRYGINSYVSGDIIYSSLRVLLSETKLSADDILMRAGDSDAAKIYYIVTTGDGYEIKSNTVSIDLVDCDHSQVVDPTADKETAGNITEPTYCEICESKFNAKITKGDDVKYYNDLDEAAKDAQKSENEGCTLYPLYNKNGYGGQLVITEGNFTLKYAVRTAFANPVLISGEAKLKVTGRCAVTTSENPDAFTVNDGDVTFEGLATGSNVTINGGNVTMAANNINCLTINGGNVSISSGGFAEIITNAEDKVIADYIDHGFWVQDRGTKEWIDIYSLNKATASSTNVLSVRVCPMQIIQPRNNVYYTNGYYPEGIPSLQINAEPWYSNEVDAKVAYQWIAIDENGNETEIEGATGRKLSLENLTTGRYYCRLTYSNAVTAGVSMKSNVVTATITECEHSGGKATCTEKAKCEICGAEYGEMKPHSYAHIKASEYLKSAATCTEKAVYYTSCTECGRSSKGTADEATFEYGNALGHSFGEWSSTAPTCTKDGSRVRKCSRCDKIETEVIPATGHKYVDTVIKPTYTEKGYTLHKCSRCGSSYKDSYTNVLVLAKISGLKTVSRTDKTAKISWNKNPNADGYIIEQYNGSRWMLIARITSNSTVSFTAKTLVAGSTNKLRARAYKGTVYSAYTYININTAPSAITGFTLKNATSSTLNVAWDRNTSGDGYILDKYDGSKWVTVAKVTNHATLNNTANNLKAGTSYKFRIRAYKVFGSVTVYGSYTYLTAGTKPAAMSGIKVKSKTNLTASLQWNKNISADGYVLDKYDGSKWVTIKTLTSNTDTSFNVTGLKASTTFKFRLRAYKNYGTAKEYSEFTYFTVNTRPYTTTGMKCNSKTNLTANLQWNKNISADGYVLDKYDGTKWVTIKTFTSNANTSFNVTGLRASTTFNFRLRAYKNFDNGKVYSEFTYLNVNTRPYTTTGFKMKSATKNSVTLQWNKNISANGYCIEKWDGSKWVQVKRYTSNANVTYTATGLKADTAYKFRIRAYKTIGNVNEYSAYSAVVTARTKK